MKLPSPFYRLPVRFDADRLQAEVSALDPKAWSRHPTGFEGNSAVRLVSVHGGENDDCVGRMGPTPWLLGSPYIRQVLAGFGVVWSRSRLMKLAPGASVPAHADVNYHWFHRVRLHIPVQTDPDVSFTCGDQTVHMAAGEAWLFDNWRMHGVHNASRRERVHLVADTSGSAAFWNLVGAGQTSDFERWPRRIPPVVPFEPKSDGRLLYESVNIASIMHPSEMEQLTTDLLGDLLPPRSEEERLARQEFVSLASGICREWRQFWALFGDGPEGWPRYLELREFAVAQSHTLDSQVLCASNGISATEAWRARVLLFACHGADGTRVRDLDRTVSSAATPAARRRDIPVRLKAPVFIVSAPRSGSSLLFETLARARDFVTVGGESHWLVESLPQLQPWAEGVGSNRLTEAHVDENVHRHIMVTLLPRLQGIDGRAHEGDVLRFLEKTPKNSLRIPFFRKVFPDARFIFLWRDPRENIGSILDAWRDGGWVTYPQLPGWDGPWSLLLPPGWQDLRGKPLEEVAAFQWRRTNEIVLDDLAQLPESEWTSVSYAEFVANPTDTIRRLTDFSQVQFDPDLAASLVQPLPLSKHTLAPPDPEKWKRHFAEINRLLPSLEPLEHRLQRLSVGRCEAR